MHLPQLHATNVGYFPPGATSKAQPIDQGIVHSVKARYRSRVAELGDSDCTDPLPLEDQIDPGVWSAVEEAFGSQQFSDYVTVDNDLVNAEQLTDEEIVAQIRKVPNEEQQADDENEEDNHLGVERARVGTPPALLHHLFQGRTVADADRRANGACLPVPTGTRLCPCDTVMSKLHRRRTGHTLPPSRDASEERPSEAASAMLARAAREADFAQWILTIATGHAARAAHRNPPNSYR
ncbi:hypothetical protein HPB52_022347 [Rhipicephalus sanguineus]|uniref:DDE-1 domain-containing protein n=1 Tax=Rhipicephalus sanguineus TaxID=34632 RepID=A0A9D4T2S6_RHISA|nr:hypothetical protein HPB52_022347 [Rhipicephalus sanguineus]